ncbi:hypothetical protein EJB05_10137, partial [Eragrostis curvula]
CRSKHPPPICKSSIASTRRRERAQGEELQDAALFVEILQGSRPRPSVWSSDTNHGEMMKASILGLVR